MISPLQLMSAVPLLLLTSGAYAQLPPADKYDTASYPEDRKSIGMMSRINDSTRFYNDDYIAVGPEGRISYGFTEWKQGFKEEGFLLKVALFVIAFAFDKITNLY